FAVLMTLCWMCANALLLDKLLSRHRGTPRDRLGILALLFGIVVLSVCIALTLSRLTIVATGVAMLGAAATWLILGRRKQEDDAEFLPPSARLERLAMVALPLVVVAAWGIWCLIVGSSALR